MSLKGEIITPVLLCRECDKNGASFFRDGLKRGGSRGPKKMGSRAKGKKDSVLVGVFALSIIGLFLLTCFGAYLCNVLLHRQKKGYIF